MQLELVGLLRQREICHPTQIQSVEFDDCACVIHLVGTPWWLDNGDCIDDAHISFRFNGIEEARISERWFGSDEYCEDLEDFTVERMSEQVWAAGDPSDIYCNAPLEDRFAILAAVDDFLVSSNCPYGSSRFLNMPTIREFGEITSTSSYKICSGPKAVCNCVVTELIRQKVHHLVVEHALRQDDRLIVKMHDGYIICRSAIAIY